MKLLMIALILAVFAEFTLCKCPNDWMDLSPFPGEEKCRVPPPYGRGEGYPWKFGDGLNLKDAKKRCKKDHPELGCEKWGAIMYPKCKEGFRNFACCVCEHVCPEGYKDEFEGVRVCVKKN